jgi:hypothetical protein
MTLRSRTPANRAADARTGGDRLIEHRPAHISDRTTNRHLSVPQER